MFLYALLRIKQPENLKEYQPDDLGRIVGLDRAPERPYGGRPRNWRSGNGGRN